MHSVKLKLVLDVEQHRTTELDADQVLLDARHGAEQAILQHPGAYSVKVVSSEVVGK